MLNLRHSGILGVALVMSITVPHSHLIQADTLATTVDFEDLALGPESFYNGSDGADEFTSHGARLNNTFTDFGSFTAWFGWSYSNTTDVSTQDFSNQYSAYQLPSGGGDSSDNYAMAFAVEPGDSFIDLPDGRIPLSMRVTNSTWAALAMLNGDPNGFSKKFGGVTGDYPDWFLLTITGEDVLGASLGNVEFYLADYRFADNSLDFVVDTWTTVGLGSLIGARRLSIGLSSSDTGMFGINTPAYLAMDNLEVVLLTGDGNADGIVNAADYTVWANGFAVGNKVTEGDYSFDGLVNAGDYTVWANHFGDSIAVAPSAGTAASVPEPSGLLLLVIGMVLASAFRYLVSHTRTSRLPSPQEVSLDS